MVIGSRRRWRRRRVAGIRNFRFPLIVVLIFAGLLSVAYLFSSRSTTSEYFLPKSSPLAQNTYHHKPVYLDFTQPGWGDELYLSNYSVDEAHHYRTNFEHDAVQQGEQGLRIVIDTANSGENWKWDSGEVQTLHETGYGRYEVIMKSASGAGLVSSFFHIYR